MSHEQQLVVVFLVGVVLGGVMMAAGVWFHLRINRWRRAGLQRAWEDHPSMFMDPPSHVRVGWHVPDWVNGPHRRG